PYAFSLDTTTLANGAHTISARARDAAGNTGVAALVNVTVTNTAPDPSNLILNPSLETLGTDGNPEHWFSNAFGQNDAVFSYPVAGFNGASAARVDITTHTDGDAKWYFADVPVTPGETYTLSHAYRSNTTTNITIVYTMSVGEPLYVWLQDAPAATDWTRTSSVFVVPDGATSMTFLHILHSAGWLEVDDFSLASGNLNQFARPMISYTFDDGWLTHYTQALPILEAAGATGVFYIMSQPTQQAESNELIANPSLEDAGTGGDPVNWFRGGWGTNTRTHTYPVAGIDGAHGARVEITAYTSGDAKWYFGDVPVTPGDNYTFSDRYQADIPSEVITRYAMTDGTHQYGHLNTLAPTNGAWNIYTKDIVIPAGTESMTIFHLIAGVGSLTVDQFSLRDGKESELYINPSQALALQSTGHEIGAHTRTHADLTTLTPAERQNEIVGSRTELLAMGVGSIETIAYPFGAYNDAVLADTQAAGYAAGRGVERGNNTTGTNKYTLRVQQVARTTTMADIQGWVTDAISNNAWLILMFHQIDHDPANTFGNSPELLQEIMAYVNAANIDIVTITQGLALMNL
ncbi:hypothetical protein C4552_04160, partial [Candidatus Parcubacteria bacterium]